MRAAAFPYAAAVLIAAPAAATELRVKDGGALFCTRLDNLRAWTLDTVRDGKVTFGLYPGCYRLKSGVRLQVGAEASRIENEVVLAVELHDHASMLAGFAMAARLESPEP